MHAEVAAEAVAVTLHTHQLLRPRYGEGAQQNLVKESEDGGGGTYAEREHQQNSDSEYRRPAELAESVAEISEHTAHGQPSIETSRKMHAQDQSGKRPSIGARRTSVGGGYRVLSGSEEVVFRNGQ
jgi:hypothetical protein